MSLAVLTRAGDACTLEVLLNAAGLSALLGDLANIAHEKAENALDAHRDSTLSRKYERFSHKLDELSELAGMLGL